MLPRQEQKTAKEKKIEKKVVGGEAAGKSLCFYHLRHSSLLIFLIAAWIDRRMKIQCTCTVYFLVVRLRFVVQEKGQVIYNRRGDFISPDLE